MSQLVAGLSQARAGRQDIAVHSQLSTAHEYGSHDTLNGSCQRADANGVAFDAFSSACVVSFGHVTFSLASSFDTSSDHKWSWLPLIKII